MSAIGPEQVVAPKEHKGFILLPKRWVVERTLGWLSVGA